MLNEVKSLLFTRYKPNENRWIFISTFDVNWNLISSNGVVDSNKELWQLVELLYHWIFESQKNIQKIVVDVVLNIYEEKNIQEIVKLSPITNWLCLVNAQDQSKSGVILPNTKWVSTIQQALLLIKQKYRLEGQVLFFVFTTDRMEILV